MGHQHDHSVKNIKTAFFLNLGFTIFEIFGGLYSNSIAIVSDAIHDLGDSIALGTSWFLQNKANSQPSRKFSFGYKRFSLLGALINSIVIIVGAVFIVNAAIGRLLEPQPSDAQSMILFAIVGVAVNGYAAWKLSSGKSMNERVVSWHLLEDVLGWVAVLVVAIVLYFTDIKYLDPALSLLITIYVLWNVLKRLKETLTLFLQGTPDDLDPGSIENELLNIANVGSIHHTHIWSLDGEHHVFSAHIILKDIKSFEQLRQIKNQIKTILSPYNFEHVTIETELNEEDCSMESGKSKVDENEV